MSSQHVSEMRVSDSAQAGEQAPEITAVHIYHKPRDDRALNGATFVVRSPGGAFTVSVREDVVGDGSVESEAAAYRTGSEEYLGFFQDRHVLVDVIGQRLLAVAPDVIALLRDLKPA